MKNNRKMREKGNSNNAPILHTIFESNRYYWSYTILYVAML